VTEQDEREEGSARPRRGTSWPASLSDCRADRYAPPQKARRCGACLTPRAMDAIAAIAGAVLKPRHWGAGYRGRQGRGGGAEIATGVGASDRFDADRLCTRRRS